MVIVLDEVVIVFVWDFVVKVGLLEDLRVCFDSFEGCNLKWIVKSFVFVDGNL